MIDYRRLLTTWYRLKLFQHKSIAEIETYQLGRFKKLIQHAYEQVPMYTEIYDSCGFKPSLFHDNDDMDAVPVITKDIVRSFPLAKRVASNMLNGKVHKETTSGSTGEPVEIWADPTESLIQALKGIRFLREWGYSPFHNTVQLWREDTDPKKSLIQKLGLFRRQIVSIMDKPDTVVENLRRSTCDVLFATRSSLEIFAEELNKRNVRIRPNILISGSEVLTNKHRQLFRTTYGCDTLEIYGCVETGNVAWGCPINPDNLHIDMETVVVSLFDLKPTPTGTKEASIAVTNLENFVMPFVKFDPGDVILLPRNSVCSCGRTLPILGKVLGRNDDILQHKGRNYNFHFFYNYFKNYLYISKYQIFQDKNGNIEFRIHLQHDTDENRKRCISDLSSAFNTHFSPINVRFVDGFTVPVTGKFKVLEKES